MFQFYLISMANSLKFFESIGCICWVIAKHPVLRTFMSFGTESWWKLYTLNTPYQQVMLSLSVQLQNGCSFCTGWSLVGNWATAAGGTLPWHIMMNLKRWRVISYHLLVVNAAAASSMNHWQIWEIIWTSKIEDANVAKGCKRMQKGHATFIYFQGFSCVFCRFLWFLCYFLCSYRSLEQHLHTANAKKLLPTNFNRVAALPKARSIGRCQKLLFCSPQTIWMWNWWKLIERPYKNEHQLYFAWLKS